MNEQTYIHEVLPLRDAMYRFARSLLLSASEAEDAVHDQLERIWRDRERVGECHNVKAYVKASLRNRCYDRLRKRCADRCCEPLAPEPVSTLAADRWEARDLVRRAMSRLPDRQREVLHLKEIEGYATAEIAAMTGYTEPSVRVVLSRARLALRAELQKLTDHGKSLY